MKVDRWEIWLADLEPVLGSEQGRTRPVFSTLDKQRLSKKFGKLTNKNLQNEILDALKFQLDL